MKQIEKLENEYRSLLSGFGGPPIGEIINKINEVIDVLNGEQTLEEKSEIPTNLDSLLDDYFEKLVVPEQGLDDAAKNYALNTAEDSEQYSARYLGYKDGAKWQKEQDDKELSEKIAAAYQLGRSDERKQKEQMLKEAVDAKIYGYDDGSYELIASWLDLPKGIYKDGDKVRVIICKKED